MQIARPGRSDAAAIRGGFMHGKYERHGARYTAAPPPGQGRTGNTRDNLFPDCVNRSLRADTKTATHADGFAGRIPAAVA